MSEKHTCVICGGTNYVLFGEKNGYKLFRCKQCALVFVHPIPQNLADIYGKEYFKKEEATTPHGYTDYDKDKEPMRAVFEKYLEKCEGLVMPQGHFHFSKPEYRQEKLVVGRRIFDVGAATGYVLDIAKKRGWTTYGSELSAYAGDMAAKRGHTMTIGKITEEKLPEVDAVMMWDVLEHVDDPRAYIRAVGKMLVQGGVLTISTPDKSSLWSRLMGVRWHLIIPPEHLYYYSPNNLSRLLQECGFEVLEVGKPSKWFSLSYIFTQLAQWQHLSLWKWCARMTDTAFFRLFALPINLRDNMFIIARKTS